MSGTQTRKTYESCAHLSNCYHHYTQRNTFLLFLTPEYVTDRLSVMSVGNDHYTLRYSPEQRSSHILALEA